jgi:hypothetical protein
VIAAHVLCLPILSGFFHKPLINIVLKSEVAVDKRQSSSFLGRVHKFVICQTRSLNIDSRTWFTFNRPCGEKDAASNLSSRQISGPRISDRKHSPASSGALGKEKFYVCSSRRR